MVQFLINVNITTIYNGLMRGIPTVIKCEEGRNILQLTKDLELDISHII